MAKFVVFYILFSPTLVEFPFARPTRLELEIRASLVFPLENCRISPSIAQDNSSVQKRAFVVDIYFFQSLVDDREPDIRKVLLTREIIPLTDQDLTSHDSRQTATWSTGFFLRLSPLFLI